MFKTKRERYAFVQGLRKGIRGGKLYKEPNVKPRTSSKKAPALKKATSFNVDDFYAAALKKSGFN